MHHLRRSSLSLQWDSPRHWSYSISPLDSDSAPLLKRCEGHLAGSPVSGELLLSGGGASQQARGGGQVCLMHVFGVSGLTCCFLLVSPALKLLADHPQLSHKCRLVQPCIRKCRRLKKKITQARARLASGDLLQPVFRCLPNTKWGLRVPVQSYAGSQAQWFSVSGRHNCLNLSRPFFYL